MRKDEDLMNDCLVSEKQLCSTLSTAVTEAATPNIRQEFQKTLSDCFCTQDSVYKAMASNGWYQVEQAEQNKISEAKTKYSNKAEW